MIRKLHYDFDTHEYTTEGPVTIADTTELAIGLMVESLSQGGVKPEKLEESANMIAEMVINSYKEKAND